MPTISVPKRQLAAGLGRASASALPDEEFSNLCFEFGVELDDIVHEDPLFAGKDIPEEKKVYRIDVPANRYDLVCVEGIVSAFRCFTGMATPPVFKAHQGALRMRVTAATKTIRPYVVCGVLRNVRFTEESYNSFIDLQEKLHHNVCRRRTLCAIGTHDLDTIEGPFVYDAQLPSDIKFRPLKQTREYTAAELMELYEKDNHLKAFLPIIRDSPVYPVIRDAKGVVLSMPPIINGEHSKITLSTRNVFIECTATDHTKACIVLDTIVSMFSQYCAEPFSYETVVVEAADGSQHVYPAMETVHVRASTRYISDCVGVRFSTSDVVALLKKMMLAATPEADGDMLVVTVPPTRSDVLHACDVMEDVAVAYGFEKLARVLPDMCTYAAPQPRNHLTEQVRRQLVGCGYTELLSFVLSSVHDQFTALGRDVPSNHVMIENPASSEYQMPRESLIPGMLKTLCSNSAAPLPLRVFEVSDVVYPDASSDTGCANERRVCAMYMGVTSGFDQIHGLLDRLMGLLEATPAHVRPVSEHDVPFARRLVAPRVTYGIIPFAAVEHASIKGACAEEPMFMIGRAAKVTVNGKRVGSLGVLHPRVLENFGLKTPTSVIDFSLEPFVEA